MPTLQLPANIETKTFAFEVKSVDEAKGIVVGYLSTFNNVDYGFDRVLPGAFTKTLNDRKSAKGKKGLFPMLWMVSSKLAYWSMHRCERG